MIGLALTLLKKGWKYIAMLVLLGVLYWLGTMLVDKIENVGYQRGLADKQKVIDQMLADQALKNKALNDKIDGLEAASRQHAADEFTLRAQLQTKASSVIDDYVKAHPQSASKCGVDQPTAQTINNLMQLDPAIFGGQK